MYTYIVVDDEILIRKGTIKKLEPLNDQIICLGEAKNGYEALKLIKSTNPDLIITDMNMPIMDGVQFLSKLAESYSDKPIIVISGYKDFEYMKQAISVQAIDYILKPFSKETIQTAVLNAIEQLEDKSQIHDQLLSSEEEKELATYNLDMQIVKNLIMGYPYSSTTFYSKRLSFINQSHDYVLITMSSKTPVNEEIMQDYLKCHGLGETALFGQHIAYDTLGFFILLMPNPMSVIPEELCHLITSYLRIQCHNPSLKVLYGISNLHHSLLDLNDCFMETMSALNNRYITDESTYFSSNTTNPNTISIEWTKVEEFLFRIEAGMEEEVQLLIKELFTYLLSLPECRLHDVKVYCDWLSDQVRNIVNTYFDQVDPPLVTNNMQNNLNQMFLLTDLEEYYKQYYSNIAQILKATSVYSIDSIVEKIKIYIGRHYQNNLTVEFVSSLFHLNRSYLSHMFKARVGETFVNYLNKIRIEKAKQLLIETNKRTYQIAKAVGYDNVKYFFRIFQKYEHMTPEQFRKINQHKVIV